MPRHFGWWLWVWRPVVIMPFPEAATYSVPPGQTSAGPSWLPWNKMETPYAVMVPTAEIIRFYYGPSTRLAQALFWGEYHNMFNADRSGVFKEGVVRVHLRRWLEDEDSWTLARYICSPLMQSEVSELYRNLQVYQINSPNLISQPDQALRCGFPFAGPTTIQGICLRLPAPTPDGPPRWFALRIERCSAPFPFDLVIVDRDNSSARGPDVEDENLIAAWAKIEKPESEVEEQTPEVFCSNEEPRRGLEPLRIDLIENRFEYLSGKALIRCCFVDRDTF